MRKFVVLLALAGLAFGGPAFAADMAAKALPPPPPPPAPVYSWTGFYVGGTVGVDWQSSTFNDPVGDIAAAPGSVHNDGTSFEAGFTAGYNWQFQSIVLGVEGDWNWANFNKTSPGYFEASPGAPATIQSKSDWFSTIRGRAGWATGNMLLYATGGVAFVNYSDAAQYNYSPYFCGQSGGYWSCPSGTATGYTVGGGIEAKLWQNWSFKLEYLYLEAPTINTTDTTQGAPYSWKYSANVVRVGANYHF
jgi:outer membrane immunogenic protein